MFVANFTPLDGHLQTSSHHGTNQHNEYDYFSQKNHPDWSIGAENMGFMEILIGENKSALFDMEKPIVSAPIAQSG